MTTPEHRQAPADPNQHPPTEQGRADQQPPVDETYQTVAETVGGVPSLRVKDNLLQGAFIAVVLMIAAPVGWLVDGLFGLLVGAIIGLFAGLILSGLFLMVLGWVRLGRRRQSRRR